MNTQEPIDESSYVLESDDPLVQHRINCDQCQALMINGVFCHETGCPNRNARYDANREQWIKYRECFECGSEVEVGESCDCMDSTEDKERD